MVWVYLEVSRLETTMVLLITKLVLSKAYRINSLAQATLVLAFPLMNDKQLTVN